MTLVVLSANHHDLRISEVESAAEELNNLATLVASDDAIDGHVLLATCNRHELILDGKRSRIADLAGEVPQASAYWGPDAVRHVMEVACGLDSMVVGEREIVGQVRSAMRAAQRAGSLSPNLERVFRAALECSRDVIANTSLGSVGRSVVAAALDLVGGAPHAHHTGPHVAAGQQPSPGMPPALIPRQLSVTDWSGRRILLVGTGAYAGATVAALRARGATDIRVFSYSGRAASFASTHSVQAERSLDLIWPDAVVSCRGAGSPTITVDALRDVAGKRGPLAVIDLARSLDVDPRVRELPWVTLVDLETIRRHLPAADAGDTERAQAIVDSRLARLHSVEVGRTMDPTIVGIRNHFAKILERELVNLPATGTIPAERAARALQHLTATLAYEQSERARAAALSGHSMEYHAAAELVFGTELPHPVTPQEETVA